MNRLISLTVLSALANLIFSCSSGSSESISSGSGTGTGNPFIVGVAYFETGEPARNSAVTVCKTGSTAEETDFSYLGKEFDSTGKTMTDENGEYRFSLNDTGDFTIIVTDGIYATSKEIEVVSKDTATITIDTIVLIDLDTIRGEIQFYGGEQSSATLYVESSNDSVEIGEDGLFVVPVSVGIHTIHIVPHSSEYRRWVGENIDSDSVLPVIEILAKEPSSTSYTCDSLIVRAFLDSNSLYDISVDEVTDKERGRIVELDTKPDILEFLAEDISEYVTVVPTEIGGLLALEELEIQYTKITELPESIGNLRELEELELNDNMLVALPSSLGDLPDLEELDLQNNQLTELPESFSNLDEIEELNINQNYLVLLGDLKTWADRYAPQWEDNQKE